MAYNPPYDAQDGTERLVSNTPPAHYIVRIQSFSLLANNNIDKYESGIFQAGGYKWKLILYPNGNKAKNVKEHVSVYLSMAETCSLSPGWEVHAVLRVFLFDRNKDNYFIVQDAMGMPERFHRVKPESGFDQFIPLTTLTNPRNGYLVDDTCVLGAEVFVSKERSTGKGESLVMLKDGLSNKYFWVIDNYSNLGREYYDSNTFTAGNYKWNIRFYPNGKGMELGSYISLYLDIAEAETLPPGKKVFAEFSLRIYDLVQSRNDFTWKASHWFSSSNPEWGWARFILLTTFKQQGLLYQDSCLVKAEVSVLGAVDPHS